MLLMLGGFSGCSSAPKAGSELPGEATPPKMVTPLRLDEPPLLTQERAEASSNSARAHTDGASAGAIRPSRGLVLVLPAGGARSLAAVGVLQVLAHEHITVSALVGAEVGALVAALYAKSGLINRLEWSLLKLRLEQYAISGGSFLDRLRSSHPEDAPKFSWPEFRSGIARTLPDLLGNARFEDCVIPLQILSNRTQGAPEILQSGTLGEAVMQGLAVSAASRAFSGESGVEYQHLRMQEDEALLIAAHALQRGGVVWIGGRSAPVSGLQLRPDITLLPQLNRISEDDFGKKSQIIYLGKKAAQSQLSALRQWVGLAP